MSEPVKPTYLLEVLEVRPNPKNFGQRIIGVAKNRHDASAFIPQVVYPYRNAYNFSFYGDCEHDADIQPGDLIEVSLEGSPTYKRWVIKKVIRNGVVVYPVAADPKASIALNNTSSVVNNTNQSSSGLFTYRPDPLPGTCLPDAPLSAPTTPSKPLASIPAATATSVSLPSTPIVVQPTTGSLSPQLPSLSATAIFYSAMMEQEAKAALRDNKVAELTEEVVQMKREQATTNRLLREIRRLLRDLILADRGEKKDNYDDEDPTEEDILGGN